MNVAYEIKLIKEKLKELGIGLTNQRAAYQSQDFDDLQDTPANKTGSGSKLIRVNSGETALEYKANAINYDAKIYLNSNQLNIVNNVNTKIAFDSTELDTGSMVDIANNKITAVVAGKYLICLNLMFNVTVANIPYYSLIRVNGVSVSKQQFPCSYTGNIRQSQSCIRTIAAGIDIEGYALQVSGGDTPDIMAGQYDTFLTVTLLGES